MQRISPHLYDTSIRFKPVQNIINIPLTQISQHYSGLGNGRHALVCWTKEKEQHSITGLCYHLCFLPPLDAPASCYITSPIPWPAPALIDHANHWNLEC